MSTQPEATPVADANQHPFEKGLALYEQKAPLDEVIALFEQGRLMSPTDTTGYTCLAWLHLLRQQEGDGEAAFQFALQALRLDSRNYQAHFNLALAMLVTKRSGVRKEFVSAMQKSSPEELAEAEANFQEAIERYPDFAEAAKMLAWMQE